MKKLYAVIDTNVLVSALLTKNPEAPPAQVLRAVLYGQIIPLYHPDITQEYREVLNRKKFGFSPQLTEALISAIESFGVKIFPQPTGEHLIDMSDLIFYEVAMEKQDEDARLVTGNLKHYPIKECIVTPAEMLAILHNNRTNNEKRQEDTP